MQMEMQFVVLCGPHTKVFLQIQKNKLRFAASSFGLDWIYLLSVCLSLGLEGLFVCIRLQWLGKREEVRVGDLSVCVH